MSRPSQAELAARCEFDQRHHQAGIDYARRAGDQDVEWRFPMASNRFKDRDQQQAYETRYRERMADSRAVPQV